jgi:hypothetical protein
MRFDAVLEQSLRSEVGGGADLASKSDMVPLSHYAHQVTVT